MLAEPAFGFNGQNSRLVLDIHDYAAEQAGVLYVVECDARTGEDSVGGVAVLESNHLS
jgi:hypothetical protein